MKRKAENQAMKKWEIKNQGGACQKRNKQTLFVNCINKNNIMSKSKEWKEKKNTENKFG